MGFLDDLLHTVEGPLDLGAGVVNGAIDGTHLVGNVIDGKWHDALDDGRKLSGDAADIGSGLASLGFNVGGLPTAIEGSKSLSADSKVIQAALFAIAGLKLTTGTGTPCDGSEFRDSGNRLDKVQHTLFTAAPHSDRWDGTASQVYDAVNDSHASLVCDVMWADLEVAGILDEEAKQVTGTRNTLDEVSKDLSAWDLATSWMNLCGAPGRAAKLAADLALVAVSMPICTTSMAGLVGDSIANALKLREQFDRYAAAAKDTSGNPIGGCEAFAPPDPDDDPLPGRDKNAGAILDPRKRAGLPSRALPSTPYTVPGLEDPPPRAPAIPYGVPARLAPASASPGPRPAPTPARSATPAVAMPARAAASATPAAPARASGGSQRAHVASSAKPISSTPSQS